MPARTIAIGGTTWRVMSSGLVTQYERDEFALVFVTGIGDQRQIRVTRYAPVRTRSRSRSLAELADEDLKRLFAHSQSGEMSPEAGYTA